jgi:transposase
MYVRPFVKTNKNDAADAEGICEAVVRPNMRFVPIKSIEQQAAMMLHRTRALLLRQRTQLINAVRGHLAEFGLVARRGARNIRELADLVRDTGSDALPDAARAMLVLLLEQIREAQVRVAKTEHALEAWAKKSDACRRLMSIPGVGIMSATALVLTMDDPNRFRSGRHFAAWLGLVPRQSSSGDRQVLGGISKRGDGYVRTLLIHGRGGQPTSRPSRLRIKQRARLGPSWPAAINFSHQEGRNPHRSTTPRRVRGQNRH